MKVRANVPLANRIRLADFAAISALKLSLDTLSFEVLSAQSEETNCR